jgi:hypothetical protein
MHHPANKIGSWQQTRTGKTQPRENGKWKKNGKTSIYPSTQSTPQTAL